MDGSTVLTHDALRGKDAFAKALNGIEYLKRNKIHVTVRVTIHKGNISELEKIAELLLEKIGLDSFSTNSICRLGLGNKNADQLTLTTGELSTAMKKILTLERKYNGRITSSAGPLSKAKRWTAMEIARIVGKESFPKGGFLTACNAVMNTIAVRSDGVMVPCIQLSHIELGRINRDNLKEVWETHTELKRMRDRQRIPLSSFEFCKGCDYINYCTGNCPVEAYTILRNIYHPNPPDCFKRFLEEGGELPDMKLFASSHNKAGV